jgi:hypothetical protein
LILPASALDGLAAHLDPADRLDLVVTAPAGPSALSAVFGDAADLPVVLRGVEVAVPAEMAPPEFFAALAQVCADIEPDAVFVEIPRDERSADCIADCAHGGYRAKFRTGGVKAELYPDEAELAAAIRAVVDAGVPFKATAGLHHAIRNTDPVTGFEQHGFLNLLLATEAALAGAGQGRMRALLAERDAETVAAGVSVVDSAATRGLFRSFGTCSVTDPLTELVALGLVPSRILDGEGAQL